MPLKQHPLSINGCKGMRRPSDLSKTDPTFAYSIVNGYPLDPINGGDIIEVPAWTTHGTTLGTASVGVPNTTGLVYQFNKTDGTGVTVCITSGKLYTYSWTTNTWTNSVTAANFATASITVSTSAKYSAVTLNDLMVVSDGTNTPWSWDGTAGAGGLTSLTNAPVFYGPIVVYYGKLFGIKNTDRGTIVWSEENAPGTGYEAGGYNNAWTLSQAGSDPLFSLVATNETLYYFRRSGIGGIRGAVTPDFSTTGVRDSVSAKVGTVFPHATTVYKNYIWFLDELCRPRCFQLGSNQLIPLYEKLGLWESKTHPDFPSAAIPGSYSLSPLAAGAGEQHCQVIAYPRLDCVLFTRSGHIYPFHSDTLECLGYWQAGEGSGGGDNCFGVLENVSAANSLEHDVLVYGTYQGTMNFMGEAASSYGSGLTFVVEHGPVFAFDNAWSRLNALTLRYRGTDTGTGDIGCTGSEGTAANTQAVTFANHASKVDGRYTTGWDEQGRWFVVKVTNASKTGNIVWRGWDMTGYVEPIDTAEV